MTKKILGIDPSLSSSGWSIIKYNPDSLDNLVVPYEENESLFDLDNSYIPELIDFGLITTNSKNKLTDRVYKLNREMERVIKHHNPDFLACEDQYSSLNPKTLKKLSHVRGQFMFLSNIYKLPFFLFYPSTVKKIFSGKGNQSKDGMIKTANDYFDLELLKKEDDIADAIAVGMSYIINKNAGELI